MAPDPIEYDSHVVDLSARFQRSTTVVASPAAAAETIIAQLNLAGDMVVAAGVKVEGWAAMVIGTSGVSLRLRIRRTDVNGTTVADTDVLTGGIAAGNKVAQDVIGFDTGIVLPGQVYVLTALVGSGAAASTVSQVFLTATIV